MKQLDQRNGLVGGGKTRRSRLVGHFVDDFFIGLYYREMIHDTIYLLCIVYFFYIYVFIYLCIMYTYLYYVFNMTILLVPPNSSCLKRAYKYANLEEKQRRKVNLGREEFVQIRQSIYVFDLFV